MTAEWDEITTKIDMNAAKRAWEDFKKEQEFTRALLDPTYRMKVRQHLERWGREERRLQAERELEDLKRSWTERPAIVQATNFSDDFSAVPTVPGIPVVS